MAINDPTYINPDDAFRGDQGASEVLGRLSRAQWEDWKARFRPYIDKLGSYATDQAAPREAAHQAQDAMGLAFDNSETAARMDRQGLGVTLDPAQREAQDRALDVNRTASMVSAGNQARISEQDRQMAVLAGGMGLENIPDEVLNR